jgi:NAD(P)-dependent dehydrogenase (short-subunit alcohol dehydrogenase family)
LNIKELFDLSDQVIVLIGSSGLLGTKYADALSQAGANLVLADKDFETSKKMAIQLNKKYNTNSFAIKVDVSKKDSIKKMVDKTMKKFSKIDVLINNAIFPEGQKERSIPFEEFPLGVWNKVISVNLTGMFLCSQEIGKIMKKQKRGVIVNVSSIYGNIGADQRIYGKSGLNSTVSYAVSKSAVLNFTRYLASYWNNQCIRVNTLSLGGVENGQDKNFIKNYSYKTMLGRMAKKDEYIGALLFLVSDASSYMTGSNLVIDGGWTSW